MKQLGFEKNKAFRDYSKRIEHGSGVREGKRKLSRPFDSTKAIHLVLRSSQARGERSLLKRRNESKVAQLIYSFAAKNNVQIFKYANAGNHLHILLKARSKRGFQAFLKTVSGLIARHVMGAKKGSAKGKFWTGLAYSKLIAWGRHFKNTINYVWQNALEGWGVIPPREQALGHVKLDFLSLYDG